MLGTAFFCLLLLVVVATGVIIITNRRQQPDYGAIAVRDPEESLAPSGPILRVLTWNIGYAALGKDADFFLDQGKSIRPLTKQQITRAAQDIAARLGDGSWDVVCLQELAEAGFLTRGVDVRGVIDNALVNRQQVFWADLRTRWVPSVLRLSHGMGSYTSKQSVDHDVVALPDATTMFLGFIPKRYAALVSRLPMEGTRKSWVVMNVHLPVYDATPAARAAQLQYLFDVAIREYTQGNFVIIAGDWNMRLDPVKFESAVGGAEFSWLADFPSDNLPEGWQVIVDCRTPTVRDLRSAYVAGHTFTTIIDGFVISPNVQVRDVKNHDLGFAQSDHNPVEATFCVRSNLS